MRKIIATTLMSLDGVIEHPEKWSLDYWTEESERLNHERLFSCDTFLLGRETYESFAEVWPTMTDDAGFADRMNNTPTYVVSTTLEKAEWNNATIIRDNVAEQVAELKARPGGDILIYGVGRLAYTLMDHGLLDELSIVLHPVLAGAGELGDLLARDGAARKVELADVHRLESGVLSLTYRPTGVGTD